ncbi:MAG: pyruvate kinase [Candidatus Omnitrophica bacterium]|nr:pyruvate kinase [Candidatus Omnitrophota bacterium]
MFHWNRTKIIATIGPASSSPAVMEELISSGIDIARINLSHGDKDQHFNLVRALRRVAKKLNSPLGILVDIPGPKIRLGLLEKRVISLKKGDILTFTAKKILGNEGNLSLNYPRVLGGIKKGSFIYLNDGLIKLRVLKAKDREVVCRVENSGEIMSGKGVNIPGVLLDDYIKEKEMQDKLIFALGLEPDFLALSFVKDKHDLLKARNFLGRKAKEIFLIAKIEKKEAVKNIDALIAESDGIMVARGDLGVETSLAKLPFLQKEIVEKCNLRGKPVIVATQILSSMVYSPLPTRAEVTDIANAILDGADCLMLSEETAVGKYPLEAVCTLRKVALITEKKFPYRKYLTQRIVKKISSLEAVSYSCVESAYHLDAKAIVVPTYSGETARWVSKFRPKATVFALTSGRDVLRKLNIFWGVYPVLFPLRVSLENLPKKVESLLNKLNVHIKSGEKIIITGSNPMGKEGSTNLIQIHQLK